MEPRDEADTISLSIDGRQTRTLHALVRDRANRRAESIAGSNLGSRMEQRLQRRVDALDAFARALAETNAGAVTHEPFDREHERLLHEELLDIYGSIRPNDAEELLQADVETVATALAGYAHRHPATPDP